MKFNVSVNHGSDDLADLIQQQRFLAAINKTSALRASCGRGFNISPDISFDRVYKDIRAKRTIYQQRMNQGVQAVVQWAGGDLGLVNYNPGHVEITVFADRLTVKATFERLTRKIKGYRTPPKRADGAWVDFTNEGATGSVNRTTQFIHCPTWKDVEGNYPAGVREKMGCLLEMKEPWLNGRMMSWYGPSGTGKTYALRALIMAWKHLFDFVVVTDPERLAANPTYYYELASKPAKNHHVRDDSDIEDPQEEVSKKRVVFIMEDSADLIIKESRTTHYDKINKLLNITDGLIGQGREDIFLVTFNEDIDSIDPAFLRHGRCLAQVEFGKFGAAECSAWLKARGVDEEVRVDQTLAELYSRLVKRESKVNLIDAHRESRRVAIR